MSIAESNKFDYDDPTQLAIVIDHLNAGIWEFNINSKNVKWSAGLYTILGYQPGELECSYNFFLEHLVYHDDRAKFLKALHTRSHDNKNVINIRLLTKNEGYQWFESISEKRTDHDELKFIGSFTNVNQRELLKLELAQNAFDFHDSNRIASVAGWDIDVTTMAITLSKETFKLYQLSDHLKLSIDEAISFFEPPHRLIFSEAINNAIKFSKPFNLELLFRTAKNHLIWIRAKGEAVIDNYNKCIKIKGIFQDIDKSRRKELELQHSTILLTDQNKRLQNFSYIVSHNLRSQTGNLQFLVNLHEESEEAEERAEAFNHIKTISNSLSSTIEHLNAIVKIHTESDTEKKTIEIERVFKNVISALQNNIENTGAIINYDFSACPFINYIPAYLESILQNLLTNALKYRNVEQNPVINCHSFKEKGHSYMIFEDNGIGIDMERNRSKVFGMYKTFHQNTDAKGIGLFMTKNQIETLGGTIEIESEVNTGTKFIIRLT